MRLLSVLSIAAIAGAGLTAPTAQADASSGTFDALSYNVAGLNEHLSGSEPQVNSELISPLLNDYDLVLLQEDWQDPNQPMRDAGIDLPPLNYHHLIVSQATHGFQSIPGVHPYGVDVARPGNGPALLADGLNRLSDFDFATDEVVRVPWRTCFGELHFEVIESAYKEFDKNTGAGEFLVGQGIDVRDDINGGASDCAALKGFSFARTTVAPGVTIDVYNLHADAGGHSRDIAARADNFAQLAEFIGANSSGHAVIVGGDTNLKTGGDNIRPDDLVTWNTFLDDTGVADVCADVDCGADDHVIDKFASRSGISVTLEPTAHVFERERFERGDGEPLSDHDALHVTFDWTVAG